MSATSTEIFAAVRNLLILISVLAVNGPFLRLEVDCADAQRELIARFSEGEGGGGKVPVRFYNSHRETRTGMRRRCCGNKGEWAFSMSVMVN